MFSFKPIQKVEILEELEDEITITAEKEVEYDMPIPKFCYFPSPHNKIVVVGNGLRIFETIKNELIHSSEYQKRHEDVIKWSPSVFIIANNFRESRKILSVSIEHPFSTIHEIPYPITNTEEISVNRMVKINENYLVCSDDYSNLRLINYNTKKCERTFRIGYQYSSQNDLLNSLKFENCFYCAVSNTISSTESVKLTDPVKGIVVKEFKGHSKNMYIEAICTFESKGKEILVVCETTRIIHFYDSSSDKFSVDNQKLVEISANEDTFKIYNIVDDSVFACFSFMNKYICCGTRNGEIKIYSIFGNELKLVKSKKIHKSKDVYKTPPNINMVELVIIDTKLKLLSSSDYDGFKISEVRGIDFSSKSDLEIQDEIERRLFILENKESYIFNNKSKFFISLALRNLKIENCLRILFL